MGSIFKRSEIESTRDELKIWRRKMEAMVHLNEVNNRLHAENQDVPPWSHTGEMSPTGFRMDMYELYQSMRDFPMVAGSRAMREQRGFLPEHEKAREALGNHQLSDEDRDTLKAYYGSNLFNDGHVHDEDSAYWEMNRKVSAIISKIPPLDKPVTVWRGENYHPRFGRGQAKERALQRIQHVINLQPGDIIRWDNCAATSIAPEIASGSIYAHPVARTGQPIRHNFDDMDLDSQDPRYSVVFEMETDRGVYIDNSVHRVGSIDEQEIVLPMGMEFEVVGHVQMKASDLGHQNSDSPYHVIKLKQVR